MGSGKDLPLYPVEAATVVCTGCKQVIRTEGGVDTYLGNLQDYQSTEHPVSGWIVCSRCRKP